MSRKLREIRALKTQRRLVDDKLRRLMVLTDPHDHRAQFRAEIERLDKAILKLAAISAEVSDEPA